MMKKIVTLLFVCMAIVGKSQTKTFTVSGKIKGLDTKEMNILIDDVNFR